jgi:pimeloyl-ACP methyl ester carboxylesterase
MEMENSSMSTLDLPDGRRLAFREEGEGPPLLLVHGSPGDGRSWARVVPHLRDRFRVICPDLPGYGGSDRLAVDQPQGRVVAMGAAVAHLAGHVEGPVHVAGHSFGGNIALQAALQLGPEKVERLTLFEPVFFRALALTGDRAALEPAAAHFEDYARRATAGEAGVVRLMFDYWFGPGAFAGMPEPVRAYLDTMALRNALDVRSTFVDTSTAGQLAVLCRQTLVVYGDRSPDIVQAIGRALLTLVPMARMLALEGANHGMLDSHPEAVARLMK